jgi:hypothetical protein
MRRLRRIVGASHVAALCFVASTGLAAPPDEQSRRQLRLTADQAMRDGRFADARDAHLALWEATGERSDLCNAGRLSYRIGDMVRAVELITLCVSTAPGPDEKAEGARLELAQARRKVVELRIRAPEGTDVSVDGQPRGRAPIAVIVAPGPHKVRGVRAGGSQAEATVDAPAGETRVVDLAPAPRPPAAKPPASPPPAPAPALRPDLRIVGAGAGVAAALLGAGVALTLVSLGEDEDAGAAVAGPSRCFIKTLPRCQDAAGAYDAGSTLRSWAVVGFAAGAAVAGATLTYALLPRGRAKLSASGTGFVLEGAW